MFASANIPYWRLATFYFFYFAFLGAWVPYWSLYLDDVLHFSAEEIGIIAALILITKIIGPYCWGLLADHWGHRLRIIRLGSLLAALTFIFLLFEQRFFYMATGVVVYSFFWNAVLSQFEVVTLAHLQEHSQRYSQIRLWGSIGFIAAVIGLGVLFDSLSVALLPGILLFMLFAIWLSSLCVSERAEPEQILRQGNSVRHFWQQLNHPHLWAFFIACFLLQFSHGPYYTFFSIYMQQLTYTRTAIGLLWGVGVAAEVLLFIVAYRFLARYSLRHLMLWTLSLSALRWFLIAAFADNIAVMLVAQCMHAASFGAMHSIAIELVKSRFDSRSSGQAQAFYSASSFGAGGAIGALLSGKFWYLGGEYLFFAAGLSVLLALLIFVTLWRVDTIE